MCRQDDVMRIKKLKKTILLLSLIIAIGAAPIIAYLAAVAGVTIETPERSAELLRSDDYVLVDVRDSGEYREKHILGAAGWPMEKIMAVRSAEDVPARLRGKRLLLICSSGLRSVAAARHLVKYAGAEAISVRGGMMAWYRLRPAPSTDGRFYSLDNSCGMSEAFPFRTSSLLEQVMVCVCAFGIKPFYMIASLALALLLWRSAAADLRALRAALLSFFAGELCCAINYLFFGEDSFLFEYLHIYGMVLSFGFVAYALMEGLDARVMHFSDPAKKCSLMPLCAGCHKSGGIPCRLRQLFQLAVVFLALIALMPLLAEIVPVSYNTDIFGTYYSYTHEALYQIYEIRVAPLAAILLFASAFVMLSVLKEKALPAGKLVAAAGIGFLGLSLFRLVIFALYRSGLAWFVCWEEITELMYICGVAVVLWIFRSRLFPGKNAGHGEAGGAGGQG
jgi:rhodanese-related sulfurtransferase